MIYSFRSPALPNLVRVSVRPESTSVALSLDHALSFDNEGRLLTLFDNGRLYRRGLDNRVVEKWRSWELGESSRVRRDLDFEDKCRLFMDVHESMCRVAHALPTHAPRDVRRRLERISGWNERAYDVDRTRFQRAYTPVTILPPDQYLALVLQATQGCHYNQCLFCDFYHNQPFHIRDEAEFRTHIQAVRDFLGEGLRLRRTIFLADANALVIPQARLLPLFEVINECFPIAPTRLNRLDLSRWKKQHPDGMTGVYSFLDAFTGKKKAAEDFAQLADLGLRRVYIGMESGHLPLLAFLHKPSMPDDVRETVRAVKAAGVNVGMIVMLGIGGDRYADGHVRDSLALLNDLPLDAGDMVYFSEFVDEPGSAYAEAAQAEGIQPLTGEAIRQQAKTIRAGLRFPIPPRISAYDIREFIY